MHMRLHCKLRLIGERCRLTNIGNTSLVLDDITLDYWFNGPADSSVSVDQFRPVCSDTTIGKLSDCQPAGHASAVPCCLWCAVQCRAVLCCAALRCAALLLANRIACCAALWCARLCSSLQAAIHGIPVVSLQLHRVAGGARSAGA